MASITSLTSSSSSSTSSIYGSRNVISGLASGLDTEALIENCVSGYKTKIATLQKKQTQYTWKQDAYRSITDKMVAMTKKYTSFTSSTNLFSQGFFNKAVTTTTVGTKNADKVSATGKSSSEVQILGVKQLAQSAQRTADVSGSILSGQLASVSGDKSTAVASDVLDLTGNVNVGTISGTMTLSWNNKSIDLTFDENDKYASVDDLVKGIQSKLADATVSKSDGSVVKANTVVNVKASSDGTISFSDATTSGSNVTITGATGDLKTTLGIDTSSSDAPSSFTVSDTTKLQKSVSKLEYLSDKSLTVNLNGTSKQVSLSFLKGKTMGDGSTDYNKAKFIDDLNEQLGKTFGTDKVTASLKSSTDSSGKSTDQLAFSVKNGSTLSISGGNDTTNSILGVKTSTTTYLDTGKKLKDMLTEDQLYGSKDSNGKRSGGLLDDAYKVEVKTEKKDAKGNTVKDDNGNIQYDISYKYEMKINGKVIGSFDEDSTVESIMSAINTSEAGVSVSYSKLTNQFVFNASETGEGSQVTFDKATDANDNEVKGFAERLFGEGRETKSGQDAIFDVSINGSNLQLSRDSNTVDLDGLSVTFKDTFGTYNGDTVTESNDEKVSFTTSSDADKIVDAIKSFVDDYNTLVQEIRDAYTTQPAKNSSGSRYEPLTDDDKADMSDSAIANYEEKAKQGLLFGDSDLSSLYTKLTSAISPSGTDGVDLRAIGISTTYSNNTTTLSLDEDALRAALSSDPDKVKNAFTKSKDSGASSNGLMASMKSVLEQYSSTSIASPGVLVKKAGTKLSSTSLTNNSLQDLIDSLDDQISTWQDRMSDKVDYYTSQFTKLEQLMSEMNSQSSALSGLLGS